MTPFAETPAFRALVVDDDPIVRRTVSFALEQESFHCDLAENGERGLALLREIHYDLVVADLRMPRLNGHALMVEVLSRQVRPKTMVLTSIDDPRMTKDLIIRGVDAVIYKPANCEALAAKAKGLVVRDRRERGHRPGPKSAAPCRNSYDSTTGSRAESEGRGPVTMSELKERLSDAAKVLPVIRAALDVANMLRSDLFDSERFAAVIRPEPALAARLLDINSIHDRTGTEKSSFGQTILRSGHVHAGAPTSEMCVVSGVALDSTRGKLLDLELAWRRAVAAGVAMDLLIKRGSHANISDGLLFSALMHSSGRTVLATYFPERYRTSIARCVERHDPLVKHEAFVFPENHAEVMCRMLVDWNVPSECCRPLRYILHDYRTLASLPEPLRTKVNLVKVAILIGQIAVRRWEPWDLIELPPRDVLEGLRIGAIGSLIEQARTQLSGMAEFQLAPTSAAERPTACRRLAYCCLSRESYDFLAAIVATMGICLSPVSLLELGEFRQNLLVNRLGICPDPSTARILSTAKCQTLVLVRDADQTKYESPIGTIIELPCCFAALHQACWEAASPHAASPHEEPARA